MDTKLSSNKVLFNKLNEYFKDNIRMSLKGGIILVIVTKDDLFYCIDIENGNIPSFIINDEKQVIKNMILEDLCRKQINDIKISYWGRYPFCLAYNEYNIYWYDILNGVMVKYISQKPIIDICCGHEHWILLTQRGKVYEWNACGAAAASGPYFAVAYGFAAMAVAVCSANDNFAFDFRFVTFASLACGFHVAIISEIVNSVDFAATDFAVMWSFCVSVFAVIDVVGAKVSLTAPFCGMSAGLAAGLEIIKAFKRKKSEKYTNFKLKPINNSSFQNEKIKMISCGYKHSLALTESGRVFCWGDNDCGQLGVDVEKSSDPIIIELNDLKIQKISCGNLHSLLLSCDGHIYAFGWNEFGQVGNGTRKQQRFPIKLELNKEFIDIASHPYYSISMSRSIDDIYYVWGESKGKDVLSPQPTEYQSFEHILRVNGMIRNMKTFDKLVEFEYSFIRNGFYSTHFQEIEELGSGSFGIVFKIKRREDSDYYKRGDKCSAIKKIEFTSDEMREYRFREFFNYKKITRDCSNNENLVQHFDAWFEEELIISSRTRICLYIQMELCHKTLDNVIKEFYKEEILKTRYDSKLKTADALTTIGYYIASQIFIQILQGINYLHTRKPPIIHRDLTPRNILLKRHETIGLCVKIADFGLIAIHHVDGQSHTNDRGAIGYMSPEVERGRKYDTKADVYSLGMVLQELFFLDMNEAYDQNTSLSKLLKTKYKKLVDICGGMLRAKVDERPTCEQILKKKSSWAISEKELQISDELKKELITKLNDENQIVFSILKSNLNERNEEFDELIGVQKANGLSLELFLAVALALLPDVALGLSLVASFIFK